MWVEWIEPFGPNNEPVYMRVEVAIAIAKQKDIASKMRKDFKYNSDNDALQDFIIVNWAYLKDH